MTMVYIRPISLVKLVQNFICKLRAYYGYMWENTVFNKFTINLPAM